MRVFIYGAGRVGRSIARAIQRNGKDHNLTLFGAWNRTFARALQTSMLLDTPTSSGDILPDQVSSCEIILLSVVDDAITDMAERLAPHLSPSQILIHTSGSLPSSIMKHPSLHTSTASCHPLQSLADDEGNPDQLIGSIFAIEGEPKALPAAKAIAEACQGEPITLKPSGKVYYHAAAVVAANYLTVLLDSANTLHQRAGVSPADSIRMLAPLLQGTLNNALHAAQSNQNSPQDTQREALARTLTGPLRRGDTETVERHMKAITKLQRKTSEADLLLDLYTTLGLRALPVAKRAGVSAEDLQHLEETLKQR